jgi:hypothetical protein
MSIKKSLLALAMAALAMMGFASSAMAVDGAITDVNTGLPPETTDVITLTGWAEFTTGSDGIKCHAKSTITPTNHEGTTGHTTFSVPEPQTCHGKGALSQCTTTAVHVTNGPYHVTVTTNDFDVTGTIVLHDTLTGFLCPSDLTLTFSAITVTPLLTGTREVTGTSVKLDGAAKWGEPIAGATISGTGKSHIFGTEANTTAHGEFGIAPEDVCTWELS